ncbi:MAG: hypothetical protein IJO44_01015, partial [Clostridia bacterium]|nr:hypothetical protein [Clostridia bacterium]
KQGFGKVGSVISFNPDYHTYGFDVDPLGPYKLDTYLVKKGRYYTKNNYKYERVVFLYGTENI